MEALYFLKFWRPTTSTTTTTSTHKENQQQKQPVSGNCGTNDIQSSVVDTDDEIEEGEDSFFELELTVPDFDNNSSNTTKKEHNTPPLDKESNSFDSKEEDLRNLANKADRKFQPSTLNLSPNDLLSKRKILPIEQHQPITKPQSPISLLKSAPSFRVLMFRKSKSVAAHKTDKTTEFGGLYVDAPRNIQKQDSKHFTVKFKLEESPGSNVSRFTRDNSLRKQISDESFSHDSSKRFSMEIIHKYLKLIKPLYIKVSRKPSDKVRFSGELSSASPSSSPGTLPAGGSPREKQGNIPAGIRVVCKHLGKSKSASATSAVVPPMVRRRDDSLLLQHDGIQSAILHCKNSFHSSRENSLLSRFASDPLDEKSMTSPRMSSEDTNR